MSDTDVNTSQIDLEKYCVTYSIPSEQFGTANDILKSKKYKLGNQIGSGGYGTVYQMQKLDSGQTLACKIIEMTRTARKHFKNELMVMLTCKKHPNIINMLEQFIISSSSDCAHFYIIMEFADGGTLAELVAKKALSESEARVYFRQIIKGIFYLHRNRIAHRDLKLDNFLLVKLAGQNIVKITDFGLSLAAYHSEKGFIESGNFAGTRPYMAPEIIRIRVFGEFRGDSCFEYNPFIADIWALGVCLFELVTSHLPFKATEDKQLLHMQENRKYSFPGANRPSAQCQQLLGAMLEPNPNSRADPFTIEHHAWLT